MQIQKCVMNFISWDDCYYYYYYWAICVWPRYLFARWAFWRVFIQKKLLTPVQNSFKFSHMINNVKQSQGVLRYKLLPLNQYSLIFRDKGITYATGCLENCCCIVKKFEMFYTIRKVKRYGNRTFGYRHIYYEYTIRVSLKYKL